MVAQVQRPTAASVVAPVPAARADSLAAISADLVEACERLAARPELVKAWAEELLQLDAIAQRLRNIVQAVT